MKRIFTFGWRSAFAALVVLPASAMAETFSQNTTYFDYGIFCALEVDHKVTAEGTVSGVVNMLRETPIFQRQTHLVPARLGVGFGVHLDVPAGMGGEMLIETLHPPMGPEGVTRELWTTNIVPGDIHYNGFTFEYDYELLPGDWSLSGSIDGRKVFRVEYVVAPPGVVTDLACGKALLG